MSDRRPSVALRLLGPFVCWLDGEPVPVTGRLRSLLAVLAAEDGTAVPFQRLTAGVWGDEPPAEPRRALQVYVTRLRGILGAEAISTEGSGYRLDAGADQVDVRRFERLVDEAATATDERQLGLVERALEEWTGEPFEAVEALPLREVEAPRLLERWLWLVEQRAELLCRGEGTGPDEALIAELTALTRRYPLREPLWERLLTALLTTGRGAEALVRYEEVRSHLADELGADPGQALQAIHARLLEPAEHGTPSRTPRQLLPDLPQFTGRTAALDRLDEVLLHSPAEAPAVVALTGIGGAGKTSLAMHWAHRHRDEFPDGQLHVDLHGFSSQLPLEPSTALEALLRGLGVPSEVIPSGTAERSALLRTELSSRRALLVLDNARDADQVRPLLPGTSARAIITSRNQMRGLTARDGVRPLTLEPFGEAEALALVRRGLGELRVAREPGAASEIVNLCGRLPLAVAIVTERAARIPSTALSELADELRDERRRLEQLTVGDDERSDLRAVFELSYRVLDPEPSALFRLLSLLPDGPFDVTSVAALSGLSRRRVSEILDALAGSHLVQQPSLGRYTLHDLLRAYAAERCSEQDDPWVADAAVARASRWLLKSLNAASAAVRPGQPALSAPSSRPLEPHDDRPEPSEFTTVAEAVDWFRRERTTLIGWVHRAVQRRLHDHVWRLVAPLSLLLEITEHRTDAESLALLATTASEQLDDPMARYVAHDCAGRAYGRARRLGDAENALAVALPNAQDLGHRQAEGAILCSLGNVRRLSGDPEEALRLHRTALGLVGAPDGSLLTPAEASIRMMIGGCHYDLHAFDDAIDATRSALECARGTGDRWRQTTCLNNLTVMLELTRDYAAAEEACAEAERLSEEIRAPALIFNALTAKGRMLVVAGDRSGAVRVWEDALTLLPATDNPQRTEVETLLEKARVPSRGRSTRRVG